MRSSPSIVPGSDQDICLVLDDFGHLGQAWRETNIQDTHIETVITDLLEGQYSNPVRVIASSRGTKTRDDIPGYFVQATYKVHRIDVSGMATAAWSGESSSRS